MESLYPEYSIKTILETAQGLLKSSEDDFVYLIAHELVRAALKHGNALSDTEFAEDIGDKNLDERDYVNSNYVWYTLDYHEIDKAAEDIDVTRIIYHQGIEDTEQKRQYESNRFSEDMERQIINIMEQTWEYYDSEICENQFDYLDPEDRIVEILQEIKDYDENICKSILKRLSSFKGNIQLTQVARPFRETIGSLIGQHINQMTKMAHQ